ncbi:protein disulfide-isomerase TMX3-like isoform X2 [Acropora muricata]|uniref:protein disulfide-isomerase TMX3-like isoform X2 n=1 Tax=Acropora muricata TaxID=159855 RepID=UPI0034E4F87D
MERRQRRRLPVAGKILEMRYEFVAYRLGRIKKQLSNMAADKDTLALFLRFSVISILSLVFFLCGCKALVQELDDSFTVLKKEGSWLVEFYAPWCGYCKKLEPVWAEVGRTLHGSDIQVAKLDATRFSGVSRDFGVRGFPTIKFVKGKRVITYEGDRTVQDILQFAEKADRAAVTELQTAAQVERVRREKSVCFILVTSGDNSELSTKLKDIYLQVAERRVIQSHFYHIDQQALPEVVQVKAPTILVSKDDFFFTFQGDVTEQNVSEWVNGERFEAFVHVSRSNFNDIAETGKVMMLAIFSEQKSKKKVNERVGKVLKSVAINQREKFHKFFQFGWMLGDTIASNIMMSSLTAPFLMAYNSTDQVYYLKQYSELREEFTEDNLVSFLDDVLGGRAQGYGGDSYFQRLYRGIWDLWRTIFDIWTTQPIAALLMFGFPLLVFSFIIYMLCIADPGPEEEDMDETELGDDEISEEEQEQKEVKEVEEADPGAKPKSD